MRLHDELRDKLAAEYALGTLRGRARERLRRRLREDQELAKAVAAWEARLAPMAGAVAPVSPPARLWRRIENQIEPTNKQRWWTPLALIASGAAAALVVVALLLPLQRAEIPASYVAVLSDPKTNQPVLIATAQRNAMVLHVNTLEPKIHVAGRSLELWALPRGAQPKSLGVLAGARSDLKLVAVADRSLGDVPALAISLEPPGGSPTGQPTGPVLYTGPCVKYW
ncbi:MAG TPA: anti-sigma factor [Burkholderiales bacterium]